jgi:hypothetical protein
MDWTLPRSREGPCQGLVVVRRVMAAAGSDTAVALKPGESDTGRAPVAHAFVMRTTNNSSRQEKVCLWDSP